MNEITKIKVNGDPESSYQLYPRNEEFAKRAGGNTGSQSGVQPDWNQNDETAADYVKNRPFYAGDPVETVFVKESTVSFADDGGLYVAEVVSTFSATVGDTYKVYWDGTVYESICADYRAGLFAIGNLSIAGAGADTGEPFFIVPDGSSIYIYTADTSASHTFSISGFSVDFVKIDEKYLPVAGDDIYGVVKKSEIVSAYQFSLKAPHDEIIKAISEFKVGKANIKWHGQNVIYAFYNDSDDSIYCIFAKEPFREHKFLNKDGFYIHTISSSIYMDVSGGNFRIYSNYGEDDKTYANINVKGENSDITLNLSCDHLAMNNNEILNRKELILSSSTANSTKKFKITVDDSGTLTATEITQ